MKYVIALIFGMLVGVALFAAGMLYNPFANQRSLSPLTVTDLPTITLSYTNVAKSNLLLTNNGESRVEPHPKKTLQLWEASVRQTTAMATVLRDGANNPTGIGVKMSSSSEDTDILRGAALVDSVWYVYLPGRGSFFIEQQENYWDYLREVVVPAYRNSANTWKGSWVGDITSGPGALNTAEVTAGSGAYAEQKLLGLESLVLRGWSVDDGPIAAEGRLIIELPRNDQDDNDQDDVAVAE